MKTALLTLSLALAFNASAAIAETTNIHPKMGNDVAKPLKATRKAKRAPAVETIHAACPSPWDVIDVPNARNPANKIWLYTCEETGVTISLPWGTPLGEGRLSGTVKGDKAAGWYR